MDRHLVRRQGRSMEAKCLPRPKRTRAGHVDRRRSLPDQCEMGSAGQVAQGRILAGAENRRHPPPLPAPRAVADGVDAGKLVDQLSGADTAGDPTRGHSSREELAPRHSTVLPGGDRDDDRVRRSVV